MIKRNQVNPEHLIIVRDLNHANAILGEIAGLKRKISAIEADMNTSIERIKTAAEAFASPRRIRLEALANGLAAFAEYHKTEMFTHRRSIPLNFGVIGFRRANEIKPKPSIKWLDVLQKLKELGLFSAIRQREEINKDALRHWSEEQLDQIGAQRLEKDQFWYEIKEEILINETSLNRMIG
ncbi:MAG: host-nuclease inhibitor Gam family protein [Magnetococcus sp. DMHC-6]